MNELIKKYFKQVLLKKNIKTEEEYQQFINTSLDNLSDDSDWEDLNKISQQIYNDIVDFKRLLIWGDYDVDGITSTSILKGIIQDHGFRVEHFIPTRELGYGLNTTTIDKLKGKIDVIVTVDCGIANYDIIEYAKELGIKIYVTDHHIAPDRIPDTINCNPQLTDKYHELAGVGVAFFIARRLNKLFYKFTNIEVDIYKYLDLLTLGTIADMVPLCKDNRIFVANGLKHFKQTSNYGLQELIEKCRIRNVTTTDISFRLAPRLNSASKLKTPELAFNILNSKTKSEAIDLINELEQLNSLRKQEENSILLDILTQIETYPYENGYLLVANTDKPGILGVVASKVTERYFKPAIIVTKKHDKLVGSGRSVEGINIYGIKEVIGPYVTKFGGHRAAVGIEFDPNNLEVIRKLMDENLRQQFINVDTTELKRDYDLEIPPYIGLHPEFVELYLQLEPFGMGNQEPRFLSNFLKLVSVNTFGKNDEHVKVYLEDMNHNVTLVSIQWNGATKYTKDLIGKDVSIIYSPTKINTDIVYTNFTTHSLLIL